MSFNYTNILPITWNITNYALTGVAGHGVGAAVEISTMSILSASPYGRYFRVPVAKILHETAECVISASTTINLQKNGGTIFEAIAQVTEPLWKYPGKTIFAGFSSYGFEILGTVVFGLQQCSHHAGHSPTAHHSHGIFTLDNLAKGLLSAIGSYIGSFLYEHLLGQHSEDVILD